MTSTRMIRWLAAVLAVAALSFPVTGAAPAAAQGSPWDAVAQCESGGNWAISTGNGYFGGLQFTPTTWATAATSAGRADLAAVLPHQVSRADQMLVAEHLAFGMGYGLSPWPHCGRLHSGQPSGLISAAGPSITLQGACDALRYDWQGTRAWAICWARKSGGGGADVHLYVNGKGFNLGRAKLCRADVGCHGISKAVAVSQFCDRNNRATIYAVDPGGRAAPKVIGEFGWRAPCQWNNAAPIF